MIIIDDDDDENSCHLKVELGMISGTKNSNLESHYRPLCAQESLPSASCGRLKLDLIGMGFSAKLVDKVIQINGEANADMLIEMLIANSTDSPDSDSFDDGTSLDEDEKELPCSLPEKIQEIQGTVPSSSPRQLKSNLIGMGFSAELVDKVIEVNGAENADRLIEILIAQSDLGDAECDIDNRSLLQKMNFSPKEIDLVNRQNGESTYVPQFVVDSQMASTSTEKMVESIDKQEVTEESTLRSLTMCLLEMGFSEEEISFAIDNFGVDVPIHELADSIFANRIAYECTKQEKETLTNRAGYCLENRNDSTYSHCGTEGEPKSISFMVESGGNVGASSVSFKCVPEETRKRKQATCKFSDDKTSSHRYHRQNRETSSVYFQDGLGNARKRKQAEVRYQNGKMPFFRNKNQKTRTSVPEAPRENMPKMKAPTDADSQRFDLKPPYFFYGNANDVCEKDWKNLSRFLYEVNPEHANSKYFSSIIRKEGYLHNLPVNDRVFSHPRPAMSIQEVLPYTMKWWPSWDTRKQLSCINTDTTGTISLCERLAKIMVQSQGVLSQEEQTDILHHCKTSNLIWVGENKLKPIGPDDIELILGYPAQYTQLMASDTERLKALKHSFQTDMLGYHLSVLKQLYPSGMRVLSVYSGIGGAVISLAKLGIHLKCVVSVESCEMKRQILRRWWDSTGQSGELKQVENIGNLNGLKFESLMDEFGGFDLIIAANPPISTAAAAENTSGVDFNLFFEFVRVFQRVRYKMDRS